MGKVKNREGEEREFRGGIGRIVEYKNRNNVIVEFQDSYKYKAHSTYQNFKVGGIINPYFAYNNNIGYIGNTKTKEDGKKKRSYYTWNSMLSRCYSGREKSSAYIGRSVCEEWLCYENFEIWYNKNYYEVDGEEMQLDKDILVKGNKIYSPNTCMFVPKRINILFVQSIGSKTRNGLIGTYLNKNKKYTSQCQTESKTNRNLGSYNTELEAFLKYKEVKEEYIKRVADKYKEVIPNHIYNAIINYKVLIDD